MGMRVRKNFVVLDKPVLTTRDDMLAVGDLIRRRIMERTARGVDAQGQPFAPYFEGYRDQKREELGATGGVDLMVSGEMLRAMTLEATDKKVTIFFAR
jgi:hypothetical protein